MHFIGGERLDHPGAISGAYERGVFGGRVTQRDGSESAKLSATKPLVQGYTKAQYRLYAHSDQALMADAERYIAARMLQMHNNSHRMHVIG